MKQRPRIYYTETDKALMWDRWQKGESLNSIASLFDRHHSAIRAVLARTGGIRPPARRRSRLASRQGAVRRTEPDWLYRLIARHPYRLFGKRDKFIVPDEKIAGRFVQEMEELPGCQKLAKYCRQACGNAL